MVSTYLRAPQWGMFLALLCPSAVLTPVETHTAAASRATTALSGKIRAI